MSIMEKAEAELDHSGFDPVEKTVLLNILESFLDTFDSGGAVAAVMPVLVRLINGQPLGPLTGVDSEWMDPLGDGLMLQNKRCGSVFKDWRKPDGHLSENAGEGTLTIHDIDNPGWDGSFPYNPPTRMPGHPVLVLDV